MNWSLFLTVFTTIFVAEMGDKTQLAALALSSESKSTLTVLLAVVLALSLAGIVGVLLGRVLGNLIDPKVMRYVAGVLFIGIGIWTLWKGVPT